MEKFILFFLMSVSFVFSQTWKNTINLNISASSVERIDIYSNSEGNHLIVTSPSQIIHYLYSSSGSLVRASTIDTHTESKRFVSITGVDETIYIIYKKGDDILSKRTENGGVSWATLTPIDLTYSSSDGIDAVSDNTFSYLTWSEKQGTSDDYETYYMKIRHTLASWQDKKEVTDEAGVKGGLPSITLAPDRVTVGFTKVDASGLDGEINRREIVNNIWQTYSHVWDGSNGVFQNSDNKTHLITNQAGVEFQGDLFHRIGHVFADIGSPIFDENDFTTISHTQTWPQEHDKTSTAKTNNSFVHIVFTIEANAYYRMWDGSEITDSESLGNNNCSDINVSSNGNDIYVAWIENGTVKLRHRDFAPLKLANFDDIWSSNHPKVTWEASEATDFQKYVVEKSTNGTTFAPCTTITSRSQTSYTDQSENKYSFGNDKTYVYYRAKQVDLQANESELTANKRFAVNAAQNSISELTVSLDAKLAVFKLEANYPNPFNPQTKISFGLPEQSNVSLKVYNIQGKDVATLAEGSQESGYYTATFDGSELTSGVYIYRFAAKGLETGKLFNEVKRMLLIK